MFKKQNGITLVALVITIIVLLILAGVSISLVVGEGGILGKATNAVDENEKATAEQEIKLSIADAQMAYYTAWTSNQSVSKASYFGDDSYYKANCTSAATNGVAISGVTATSTSGTVTVTYKTKSNVTYTYSFTLDNPETLTYVSGPVK